MPQGLCSPTSLWPYFILFQHWMWWDLGNRLKPTTSQYSVGRGGPKYIFCCETRAQLERLGGNKCSVLVRHWKRASVLKNNEAAPPTATLSPLPVVVVWGQNQTLNLFASFLPHSATEFFNLMCNDILEDVQSVVGFCFCQKRVLK